MDNVDFDFVKQYMRIDSDAEDGVIQVLISAAVAYLDSAGVTAENTDPAQYTLAVAKMVADDYENRNTTDDKKDWGPAMRRRIVQMKLDSSLHRVI